MKKTYCGKDCDNCTVKQEMNCPGCKDGMGYTFNHHCDIVNCCREKNLSSCSDCMSHDICCRRLDEQEAMPQTLLRLHNASLQDEAHMLDSAQFFGKWLSCLFWVLIATLLLSNLSIPVLQERAPVLYWGFTIACLVFSVCEVFIFFKMSARKSDFRSVGICYIAASILTVVQALGFNNILINIVALAISLFASYQLYTTFSELMYPFDHTLSENWGKLWKYYSLSLKIFFVGLVVSFLFPILIFVVLFAFLAVMIVWDVLKYVYLYRSATVFKNYVERCSTFEDSCN